MGICTPDGFGNVTGDGKADNSIAVHAGSKPDINLSTLDGSDN